MRRIELCNLLSELWLTAEAFDRQFFSDGDEQKSFFSFTAVLANTDLNTTTVFFGDKINPSIMGLGPRGGTNELAQ